MKILFGMPLTVKVPESRQEFVFPTVKKIDGSYKEEGFPLFILDFESRQT